MVDRIKEILESESFSYGSFADEIGVQRSSISHILSGRNNPSLDFIIKTLHRFPKINAEWLLLGNGNMFNDEVAGSHHAESKLETPDLFTAFSKDPLIQKEMPNEVIEVEKPVNEIEMHKTSTKHVSQILIFYSDSTYQVYKPENPA